MARGKAFGGGPKTAARKDEEERVCPLCITPLDETEQGFYPCPCRYQVCLFCFGKVKEVCNSLCPGCRQEYQSEQEIYAKRSAPKKSVPVSRSTDTKSSSDRATRNGLASTGSNGTTKASSSQRAAVTNHAPTTAPSFPPVHAPISVPTAAAAAPILPASQETLQDNKQDAGGATATAAKLATKPASSATAHRLAPQVPTGPVVVPRANGAGCPPRAAPREISGSASASKPPPALSASPRLAPHVHGGSASAPSGSSSAWPRLSDAAIAAAVPQRSLPLRETASGESASSLLQPAAASSGGSSALQQAPAGSNARYVKAVPPPPLEASNGIISQHDPKVQPLANGGFKAPTQLPTQLPQSTNQAPSRTLVSAAVPFGRPPQGPHSRPPWLEDLTCEQHWKPTVDPQASLFVAEMKREVMKGSVPSRDGAMKLLEYVHDRANAQGTPLSAFGSSLEPLGLREPGTSADKSRQPAGANSWATAPTPAAVQTASPWDSVLPSPPSSHQHFPQSMWAPITYVPNGIWADGLHGKSSVPQMGHTVPQSSHSVAQQGSRQGHGSSLWPSSLTGHSFR